MNYNITIKCISDTVEMIYSHKCITRREYLNIKAILSNPDFNNHSTYLINQILGPGRDPATGEVVWTF